MKGRRSMYHMLLAVLIGHSSPMTLDEVPHPPAMNISAIHNIMCQYPDEDGIHEDYASGSGWVINNTTIVTANHVIAKGECEDVTTGTPVVVFKTDKRHDLALVTEPDVRLLGPPVRYTCERPRPGQPYISYGITSYGLDDFFKPIVRNNTIWATKDIDNKTNDVLGFQNSQGMRSYNGDIAEGMSGGPVADISGLTYALNNAGDDYSSLDFDLADTGLCTGKWS